MEGREAVDWLTTKGICRIQSDKCLRPIAAVELRSTFLCCNPLSIRTDSPSPLFSEETGLSAHVCCALRCSAAKTQISNSGCCALSCPALTLSPILRYLHVPRRLLTFDRVWYLSQHHGMSPSNRSGFVLLPSFLRCRWLDIAYRVSPQRSLRELLSSWVDSDPAERNIGRHTVVIYSLLKIYLGIPPTLCSIL